MVNALGNVQAPQPQVGQRIRHDPIMPKNLGAPARRDILALGGGKPLSREDTGRIVLERAMNQLRAVVDEARAELGLAPGDALDTSEEATAGRIIDFALNFFGRYAENNRLADDEEGRTQFASFIGAAIAQGISEAEGILSALNATSESGGFDIGFTRSLIQERLDNFVANGL